MALDAKNHSSIMKPMSKSAIQNQNMKKDNKTEFLVGFGLPDKLT